MKHIAPDKGTLLVSEPSIIGDDSFSRSVILLTESNKEGVVGFILNKLLNCTLDQLIPEINLQLEVYQGGPVETDNLYFLHNIPDLIPGSLLIEDGIYWGGDFDAVSDLLKKGTITSGEIKFFLGYSGWERQQLEEELNSNSWVVVENTDSKNLLSNSMQDIWKKKMKHLGGNYELWSNAPENPSSN
ncbi:YqgE/AlgH family protein [Nonlabens sp.]|uniref:YqgE/AlgH family protein n=1 Tax=Nonlabens sp. TaxID=1888209 RepID=UPI001BCB3FF8|nr:YqgE/AlgH family protein [Nonlabens sp.]